jgi:hypothetical protein
MPSQDHPSQRSTVDTAAHYAREALLAAAVAYREVALRDDSTATLQQHLHAENRLIEAVDRYTAIDTTRTVPHRMVEQWRGPGFYRVTVSDPNGATSGTVAVDTVAELADAATQIGSDTADAIVDAEFTGPRHGTIR